MKPLAKKCRNFFRQLLVWFSQEWFFLILMALSVGLCAFALDTVVSQLRQMHFFILNVTSCLHWSLQFLIWLTFSLTLVLFSVGVCHNVSPQAVGSGIPEIKTILRGVMLKEYLSLRTLVAKVVGLTAAQSSGLPIGKEGPLVHTSCIFGTLISQVFGRFNKSYMNESRNIEMLSAACAVGVATTFGAPIGGVLFSIETTTSYFAVRNYWRGFFAATCSTIFYQFLSILTSDASTFSPAYETSFALIDAFDPLEIFFYSLVGVICGVGGSLFVLFHRTITLKLRNYKTIKRLFSINVYIYPFLVTLFIISIAYPSGNGQYMASSFFGAALCNTLPIPAGVFVPVFVIGAACGRLFGETMIVIFPAGFLTENELSIHPGSYALVGAAAFAGSVTHTISTAIIAFEMTGQVVYLVPVMVGVLISNAIAVFLQPSIYDSIIRLRKLPNLPDLKRSNAKIHTTLVKDFMVRNVLFITTKSTYHDLQQLLITSSLKAFPVVDDKNSMILLGLVGRAQLEKLVQNYKPQEFPLKKQRSLSSLQSESSSFHNFQMYKEDQIKSKAFFNKHALTPPFGKSLYERKRNASLPNEVLNCAGGQQKEIIDLSNMEMDPAPIQLLEKTPLAKAHLLFSLLRLHQIYVTRMGRLIGVVSLNDLHEALLKSDKNASTNASLDDSQCSTAALTISN